MLDFQEVGWKIHSTLIGSSIPYEFGLGVIKATKMFLLQRLYNLCGGAVGDKIHARYNTRQNLIRHQSDMKCTEMRRPE